MYTPFASLTNQILDPSWNGVMGQTGEGFEKGFENTAGHLIGVLEGITGYGAVMRGPTGIGPTTDTLGGQSGYMMATWWPYTPISEGDGENHPKNFLEQNGVAGVGPQKIWRRKYYIPQGVLGRDASGNPYPSTKFTKGTTGRYDPRETLDTSIIFEAPKIIATTSVSVGVSTGIPSAVSADSDNILYVEGNTVVKKNITAYYSDERLKTFKGTIKNPIEKIKQLNGYYFVENELAKSLGYNNDKIQVGVSAQEVEKVLPEIVTQAPVGKEYKTVWYEKLTPLLIEGVKEQQNQIDELKILVASLMKK
tara:strand:+ start:1092 stop:2015 length:924 start_codon:yes stop_codon:yes gene_type:complete